MEITISSPILKKKIEKCILKIFPSMVGNLMELTLIENFVIPKFEFGNILREIIYWQKRGKDESKFQNLIKVLS